jgi:hypothetical protein
MQLTTGRADDDVGCGGVRMWVSQYLEKRANAEREVEVGRRRGSVLKAEDLTGYCSSVCGARGRCLVP